MDTKRVLVFPSGSEIGLELYRSLRFAKEVDLWGASSVADHGRFAFHQHIDGLPFVTHERFLEDINRAAREFGFDYIYPAHDAVIVTLAKAASQGELACKLMTSPFTTCELVRSKRRTMELFCNELVTPRLYRDLAEVKEWPVFLKPDMGQGSKGTSVAHCEMDIRNAFDRDSSLLLQEFLPGDEYTIDCFTDRHGRLQFAAGRSRTRVLNGISVNTVPFCDPEIRRIAEIINQRLTFRGMWFFQLKRNIRNELALMEIAPRVAGGMAMYRNLGVNFALLSLYDAEGYDVQPLVNEFDIEMDRALENVFRLRIHYTDVYVDLDDCLIIRDRVNTQLVAFLYQCVSDRKRIHLISRHAGELAATLARHRLSGLFDSVLQLDRVESKADHILSRDAIFIDDSFAERWDVFHRTGIPVFGPDAVESLLNSAPSSLETPAFEVDRPDAS